MLPIDIWLASLPFSNGGLYLAETQITHPLTGLMTTVKARIELALMGGKELASYLTLFYADPFSNRRLPVRQFHVVSELDFSTKVADQQIATSVIRSLMARTTAS